MSTIEDAARLLVQARNTRQPLPAADAPLPDAAAAYAVQQAVADSFGWFDEARPPRHWKSGGPSRDAVLTHAALPPDGVWTSPAESRDWPFRMRGIEAEIALRLARDVDPAFAAQLDHAQAATLIDAMCVSIEIVDSRWVEGLDASPMAKLADLQSHGALVLGAWVAFRAIDWSAQACHVKIGGGAASEWRGTHSMSDPCFLLPAWLRHATRNGASVAAGTVVTTGTWVGILPAAAGDLVSAEFPGIGSASVQL
ncbi:MAG: fumarylacetoacetate hydrolase family protein [Burkholderiaceae bacterium]